MNEITTYANQPKSVDAPLTVAQVLSGAQLIQQILQKVMKKGTHYDALPGCGPKPVLLKPGAEQILTTFRISVQPEVQDLSDSDVAKFRVLARGVARDGTTVGIGVGEASSGEEKWKWRAAVCEEEYAATPPDRCRIKYKRDKSQTKQVRVEPADISNTVLKMAKKRALVDLCLTATAASDCFQQDLDELSEELRQAVQSEDGPPIQQPKRKSEGQAPSSATPKTAPPTKPAAAKPAPAAAKPVQGEVVEHDHTPGGADLSYDGEIPETESYGMPKMPSGAELDDCERIEGKVEKYFQADKNKAGEPLVDRDGNPQKRHAVCVNKIWYSTFDQDLGDFAGGLKGKVVMLWGRENNGFWNLMRIQQQVNA